jgi:hypothetical protein
MCGATWDFRFGPEADIGANMAPPHQADIPISMRYRQRNYA